MRELTKIKIPYVISATIIAVALMFLFIGLFLALKPVDIIKPNTQPYRVLTPVVKAGEPMVYEVDACKNKDLPSMVSRRFVDEAGVRYPLPTIESNVILGCNKSGVPVATYPTMKPGKWYLALDVTYQVNLLRSQSYHFTTDTFEIKE